MWHVYTRETNFSESDSDLVNALQSRLETAEASLRQIQAVLPPLFKKVIQSMDKPLAPPHPADSEFIDIVDSFKTLSLDSNSASDPGFQGKSSAAMLVKAAVEVKTGGEHSSSRSNLDVPQHRLNGLRIISSHNLTFPAHHLMPSLISLYFNNVNSFLPILHRPTFNQRLNEQLHIVDNGFGTILLLVCALGSLYLTGSTEPTLDGGKLAWECYDQVELCGHSLRGPPTLYDIQAYCLATQFLHCSSGPRSAWVIAGFGLRLAQDVGFHRDRFNGRTISVDEELEKRVFWQVVIVLSLPLIQSTCRRCRSLLYLDTQLSGGLGRSAVHDPVELDVALPHELPSEYDAVYWRTSGLGPQPPEKPSTLAFFNCLINLYRLLHFSLRALYTTHVNQMRMESAKSLGSIAAELDSALDNWFSTIPEHLVLHPERPDALFFDQSAVLLCVGYYTRIILHRPFILGLSLSIPSVGQSNSRAPTICAEAARACIRVADIQQRKRPNNPLIFSQNPIFTAAMILLLNQSEAGNLPADLAFISTAIDIFKNQQRFWPSSGFFIMVLERLTASNLPSLKHLHDVPRDSCVANTHERIMAPLQSDSPFRAASSLVVPATSEGLASMLNATPNSQLSDVMIPPAFVGDEEILPRRAHRPCVIPRGG
ncbi:Zn(2)-C6 fungal-type domain-containing protein [Mycena sanguinolenta]|uniref:Zn(2)-C6 fungal-type domain-containing protein n=1 Tax=Mycena sanguinolenta TaxID=230812 RepID=A0A8H6XHM8_9AGAR|nr:Zn(2)-C6 fungal-type domain-containing protein [Mycena sanguinolenta]